jgi:hypothetical protein
MAVDPMWWPRLMPASARNPRCSSALLWIPAIRVHRSVPVPAPVPSAAEPSVGRAVCTHCPKTRCSPAPAPSTPPGELPTDTTPSSVRSPPSLNLPQVVVAQVHPLPPVAARRPAPRVQAPAPLQVLVAPRRARAAVRLLVEHPPAPRQARAVVLLPALRVAAPRVPRAAVLRPAPVAPPRVRLIPTVRE